MTNSSEEKTVTPLQCLWGALISGGLGLLLYRLDSAIAHTFANKPLPTANTTALNLSVAVRTLVVGSITLVTCLFAIASLGLVALALQTAWQNRQNPDQQ
ncbi:DUF3082 domain-containing protein [Spirulina subsalsa FACHB-351]|uniref:DUF3082 domain-containing protein n=1 Tax=Spirulina subsalsa FACHB-351 TaxID=234711 RepID=A0ABT3L7V9_9CYAN|nr:DUF3082 domain-containing protein [Spirulina subsalsa]MCW6037598.1 DUF3082 domain-containing protein [Spirulina subsalsa FACHB-351]